MARRYSRSSEAHLQGNWMPIHHHSKTQRFIIILYTLFDIFLILNFSFLQVGAKKTQIAITTRLVSTISARTNAVWFTVSFPTRCARWISGPTRPPVSVTRTGSGATPPSVCVQNRGIAFPDSTAKPETVVPWAQAAIPAPMARSRITMNAPEKETISANGRDPQSTSHQTRGKTSARMLENPFVMSRSRILKNVIDKRKYTKSFQYWSRV